MNANLSNYFRIIFRAIGDIHEGYKSVSLTKNETDKDINDILSNAKDRAEFNKALQKLKDERVKGIVSQEDVKFSNGEKTITISLE